jgi:hypothetical protein
VSTADDATTALPAAEHLTMIQPAARPVEPVRLADHPRARAGIRRARAWAGLGAFALVALLSLQAGVPGSTALARGLGAGVTGFFAGWMCALAVWRSIVLAELEQARVAHEERLEDRRRQAEERRAAAMAAAGRF